MCRERTREGGGGVCLYEYNYRAVKTEAKVEYECWLGACWSEGSE